MVNENPDKEPNDDRPRHQCFNCGRPAWEPGGVCDRCGDDDEPCERPYG